MDSRHDPRMTRRQVLLGGAGALLLAACGDDAGLSTATTAPPDTSELASQLTLVQFFGPDILVPGSPQRAPFGLGDKDGVITKGGPDTIVFQLSLNGTAVGGPIAVDRHDSGLPRPYFPLVFTPDQPGNYDASVDLGDGIATATFTVSDAAKVAVPQPGAKMPMLATPTPTAKAGVDPICTRDPECPLHDVTLADALTEGRPVAFLISTPKFCQVAICGPVLDVLIAQQATFGDKVRMLHAEVYTDDTATTTTPAVNTLGLTFEPCLFLANADGTVAHRLDNIFDAVELQAALTSLVG